MDPPTKRRRERGASAGIRPAVLALGLGLAWFARNPDISAPSDAPNWGVALVLGGRLAADLVGALVVVSLARLTLAMARLGLLRWRTQRGVDGR